VTAPGSSRRDAPAEAPVVMGTRACLCGDVTGQAREVVRAIKALVEAAGGTMDRVAKLNTYMAEGA
jgi:enamine deaminase RidA (YjgF/YER057c/UK114 family)